MTTLTYCRWPSQSACTCLISTVEAHQVIAPGLPEQWCAVVFTSSKRAVDVTCHLSSEASQTRLIVDVVQRAQLLLLLAALVLLEGFALWPFDSSIGDRAGVAAMLALVTSPMTVPTIRMLAWRGAVVACSSGVRIRDSMFCRRGWMIPWSQIDVVIETEFRHPVKTECGFSPFPDDEIT